MSSPVTLTISKDKNNENNDINTDEGTYVSSIGLYIRNQAIATDTLKEILKNRRLLSFKQVTTLSASDLDPSTRQSDILVTGVIYEKAEKTNDNGTQFLSWCITNLESDIEGCVRKARVNLFQKAQSEWWKTEVGSVVIVMNPKVMPSKTQNTNTILQKFTSSGTNTIAPMPMMAVANPEAVAKVGKCTHLGTCRAMKKSNNRCTEPLDTRTGSGFCRWHISQAGKNFEIHRKKLQHSLLQICTIKEQGALSSHTHRKSFTRAN
eukprot:GHVR01171430.1.p1 GENE.GHVR01171430.1~~GHVR01171430.1.p1  ORF type:complete len:275 (+),score=37.71 GHVR01171430.1:35-826(+)